MFTEEDKRLIVELGLAGNTKSEQMAQLAEYYEALQIHIGLALEDQLTDAQLAEFEKVYDAGDDAATEAWTRQAVPGYDAIVAAETASLKQSIKTTADTIRRAVDDSK